MLKIILILNMGGCCAREELDIDKRTFLQYPQEETSCFIKPVSKPELKLEINKLIKEDEEIQLSNIINKLKDIYNDKVKIFTEIELFNLAIYFKENYVNSDYLIFDMRISSEQKEYYLKKIKHINYTFDQIKKIKAIKKFDILQSFIDNKKIIIIIPEYYLNTKNNREGYKNVEEYPIELCNLLFNINNNICFKILNKCLGKSKDKPDRIEDYLSVFHLYDIIPFILFTYQHMTTFYKEGYFFISFLNKQIFSFDDYINNYETQITNEGNNAKSSELIIKYKFLGEMNITTIFIIDNNLQKELYIKEYQYQKNEFREININKNDIKTNITKVNEICDWLKQEIKKGHSCYFNIENYITDDLNNEIQENNWIFIVIILITLVTEVNYISVINYLKEKMIYIENIDKVFEKDVNEDEISDTISKYSYI